MNDDRNKTVLTKQVTAAALTYFDERGCKPIETEVSVCDGWIADLAGVISPTMTELVDLRLIRRNPGYCHEGYAKWAEELHTAQRLMTVLVEVKTSRSDFKGDRKWAADCPVNLCYLAIPYDLAVRPDEYPIGWGILAYYADSISLRLIRPPSIHEVSENKQLYTVLSIAERRDNVTRYERLNALRKEISANQNADISRTRSLAAMKAMKAIVEGRHGSVKEALDYFGIKHIPAHFTEDLEKLWAVVPRIEGPKTFQETMQEHLN